MSYSDSNKKWKHVPDAPVGNVLCCSKNTRRVSHEQSGIEEKEKENSEQVGFHGADRNNPRVHGDDDFCSETLIL